jgi:phenylacetic acid degradation operon negative regulatory protein
MSIGLGDEEIVRRAWDLDEVTARYEQLLVRFSGMAPEPGDPLLFTHVQLVSEWQRFPFLDPQLPAELCPDWIGRRAAVVFRQLRAQWYDDAQARWREVVKETSPA